jgi:guanine deaminase
MKAAASRKGYLGQLIHIVESREGVQPSRIEHIPSGALVVGESGQIERSGSAAELRKKYPDIVWQDFGDKFIVPGFVDTHVHFPQLAMIGTMAGALLEWLRKAFHYETKFTDIGFARKAAELFCRELVRQGTTTAVVFSSSLEEPTEVLFEHLERSGLRAVVGKVSMDLDAPNSLLMDVASEERAQERLIKKWHGKNDMLYCAVTPRFPLCCSPELFALLGDLKKRTSDLYVQTHHSENPREIDAVLAAFPKAKNYLDVYASYGLIGPQSILAHSIHITSTEVEMLKERGGGIAHCPSSNLFLGSGFFALRHLRSEGLKIGIGTDVGAGTSFSMWRTMADGYQVSHFVSQSSPVNAADLLYHATLGGADVLGMKGRLGNFTAGKDADFQVIDWRRSPLLEMRIGLCESVDDVVSALIYHIEPGMIEKVAIRGRFR